MNLSNSGKIAIVDDDIEDAKILMNSFSKNKVPYIYLSGNNKELPETHLNLRFLFLDINLIEGLGQEENIEYLVSFLKNLIPENPKPYFIFFWTSKKELIDKIINLLNEANITPIGYTNLGKEEVKILHSEDINKAFKLISTKIGNAIVEFKAFEFYIEWENVVNSSTFKYVNELSDLISEKISTNNFDRNNDDSELFFSKEWNTHAMRLFIKLSEHCLGIEQYKSSDNDKKIEALNSILYSSFEDSLRKEIKQYTPSLDFSEKIEGNIQNNDNNLEISTTAKLNSKLFFYFNENQLFRYGSIKIPDTTKNTRNLSIKDSIANSIFKNKENQYKKYLENNKGKTNNKITDTQEKLSYINKFVNDSKLCLLNITPECDIANEKWLINKSNNTSHRIIYGLLFNMDDKISDFKKKYGSTSEALFYINHFKYKDNKNYIMIFHFGSITHKWFSRDEKSDFSISRELIFDMQSKASMHVNRLGNSQLIY